MQRVISRFVFTTGFALIALLALIGSSSGVSANLPYPECGPAIPCAPYGYAPYAYQQPVSIYNSTPYFNGNVPLYNYAYRAPSYAYPAPVYAPTYYGNYNNVGIASSVFTRNGCAVGNYTCLRDKDIDVPFAYSFYR